jgi:2-dehydropantoate 2-reductase
MRVAIAGAGAIGGAIGLRLANSGHDVALIARGAHLKTMQTNGATLVDHVHNQTFTQHVCVAADPRQLPVQDLVVIGLKAHGIAAMLPQLAGCIGPNTVVLPAINGLPWWYFSRHGGVLESRVVRCLDPQGTMFKQLDTQHILGCVVHTAGEVRAPGEIHWTSGKRLIIGELDGAITPRMTAVCDALDAAGFATERVTDIRKAVWTKLIGNLSFNPIAALTGYLMNEICADEAVLDIIRPMMVEGMAVAKAVGVEIQMGVEERINLARQLGAAKISMLQDIEARRRLELEAIVGSVIELADDFGIAVPTIKHVYALIAARAAKLGLQAA